MPARLSNRRRPRGYDRAALRGGVVHLGLGAFHRAHQAPVFDALVAGGDPRWGIVGVAMRSPAVVDALRAQDGLYSLSARGGEEGAPRVIGAIGAFHVAARDPAAVVAAMAAADAHVVTMTVTEKGYLDPAATGPAGLIAAALARRHRDGLAPLTILSCDNRSGNGPAAREAVLAAGQAAALPDAVMGWIAGAVAFPSSMVDRITPATTPAMIDESSAALGLRDEAAVWTEPFWQWVVEDGFAAARPDLAAAGVQVVADVAPWEAAKLRLLNAAHSALAYLGLPRGHRHVHEAIADPVLARVVGEVWDEAAVTLDGAVVDIAAYRVALLRRFANAALPHALIQIAADGSQKLPPRILATMAARGARGLASPALARVVAGWAQAIATIDGIADPLRDAVRPIARDRDPAGAAAGLIGRIGGPAEGPVPDEVARAIALFRETCGPGASVAGMT